MNMFTETGRRAPDDNIARRIADVMLAEERQGLRLSLRGRILAMLAIGTLLLFVVPLHEALYYHALLLLFVLLGIAGYALGQSAWARPWHRYALATLDLALLTFTLLYPSPLETSDAPPQVVLRLNIFIYFFVVLGVLAYTYRPALVLWGGVAGALCWSLGVAWLVSLPDSVTTIPPGLSLQELTDLVLSPTFIDLSVRLQEVVVYLIVAGLLAGIVYRSRRLVLRQVAAERGRARLARYFSPATVDLLSQQDNPFAEEREHKAAVMFADIVGFTAWAEGKPPRTVIAMLREVHALMEEAVFRHGGTLDKFIGDGMMATFGTPLPGPRDAANAVACARAIAAEIDALNARRRAAGEAPVPLSIGLHYGPVVVGDIGTERRLEFAVLGDTVNVASRLEDATRVLGCRVAISAETVAALRDSAPDDADALLAGLRDCGPVDLRGRHEPVSVWML